MNTSKNREFVFICTLFMLFLAFMMRVYGGQWALAVQIVPPVGGSSAGLTRIPAAIVRPRLGDASNLAPSATARPTVAPTDKLPQRNAVDERGVFYDEKGVAVTGLIADSSGVHNVPPGRLVRIGGPNGKLYEVLLGGKIKKVSE